MTEQTTIIVAIAILLVFAVVFLYVQMYSLQQQVRKQWDDVLTKLGERLDKIPNLIETMRLNGAKQEMLEKDLIALRGKAWPLDKLGKERVLVELDVTARLRDAWKVAGLHPELATDTNYLALRSEFKDVAAEIEEVAALFNKKVRQYNRTRGFILLRPLMLLMGFRKLRVFEFEPS